MSDWKKNLLLIITLFSPSLLLAEEIIQFYRYKDASGGTVISSTLSPEALNQGYEVLDKQGNVIDTVNSTQSEAEQQQAASQQQQKYKQEQEEKEAQREKDQLLLRSFNTSEDIERAHDNELKALAVAEEIVKNSSVALNKQLENVQTAMATYKQEGTPIPATLEKIFNDTTRQLNENTRFLRKKEEEREKIKQKYDNLLQRFKELSKKSSTPAAP